MDHGQIVHVCPLETSAEKVFNAASQQLSLSERSADALLTVARTIADLAESEQIQPNHLAEAIASHPKQIS